MTRSILIKVLIAKSMLDMILVGALTVGSYISMFPPYFHGWGEATTHSIAGWAVNSNSPWDRVEVQLFIDGQFVSASKADQSRPDVAAAGWAKDQWHGYRFNVADLKEGVHEARVYAAHESADASRRTSQLLGDPIRFVVEPDGTLIDVSKSGVVH